MSVNVKKSEKVKKRSRTFKFLIIILILFLGWIPLADWLASILIVKKPLEKADAIFVLAGSSVYIERNQKAAMLYKEGIASKIFLTNDGARGGWNKKEQKNPYFVERAYQELISQGVSENDIEILPGTVNGTKDEARLFVEIAREKDLKSVLLVTSAYHTRRALQVFEMEALKNKLPIEIGIESPQTGQQTPPPFTWWLSGGGWELVGLEYVKTLYYQLVY